MTPTPRSPASALWSSPIYRFRVPDPARPQGNQLIEVVFDVTLSAPSFDRPSAVMKRVLTKVTSDHLRSGGTILDFGAGKLRNSLFLLRRGFRVGGVEFEKLSQTNAGKTAYHNARTRHRKFWTLVYPDDFLAAPQTFDLALLVNVLNIMPVPAERLLVIQESYRKLNAGGHVLWYSQYGDADYKKRCTDDVRFGDGYYIGKNRRFKTFYREYSAAEMDSVMVANGFEFVKSFVVPRNHVRLYRKTDVAPVTHALTLAELQRQIPRDARIADPKEKRPKRVRRTATVKEIRPDPRSLSVEERFIAGLKDIPPGRKHASKYHSLIAAILGYLFMPDRLRRKKEEFEVDQGRKRIDIVYTRGDVGFFDRLDAHHHIQSPLIIIECKNYSEDVTNPEMDQLQGRLNAGRGLFGLLVCRRNDDQEAVVARCRAARKDGKTLIVLEDADILQLLRRRLAGKADEIDDYLEDKLLQVID